MENSGWAGFTDGDAAVVGREAAGKSSVSNATMVNPRWRML